MIGDVRIYVTKIMDERVKLAVEAPRHTKVLRGELVRGPKNTSEDGTKK